MKIYLDIDGTLLGQSSTPAKCLHEFLDYILEHHDCYWLTTHCKGNAEGALNSLRRNNVPQSTLDLAIKIKATNWDVLKTDAIDIGKDFVWFDDSPMASELIVLEKNNKKDSLYHMNTRQNEYAICEALDWLIKQEK